MPNSFNIGIEIARNGKTYKQMKEQFEFTASNLSNYVNVLRSVQKNVNCALTEIVEQEKSNDTTLDENVEDEDEQSDEEEISNATAKRKLPPHKNNKKLKQS